MTIAPTVTNADLAARRARCLTALRQSAWAERRIGTMRDEWTGDPGVFAYAVEMDVVGELDKIGAEVWP